MKRTAGVAPWATTQRSSSPKKREQRPRSRHGLPVAPWPVRLGKGAVLALFAAVIVVPFLSVISTSLADQAQINQMGGLVLWPTNPNLDAYRTILSGGVVVQSLIVSIGVTTVGTALSVLLTVLLAYGLAREGTFFHRPAILLVLFSILFAPGIIPSFLMISQLGLLNSYWSLILPAAVTGFNVVVLRAFFMDLPSEIIDAAKVDGASELRILLQIVLPLSKAAIAVIALFYGVMYWDSYFNALLYISDSAKWPLQLVLRAYVVNDAQLGRGSVPLGQSPPPQQAIKMAILVLAMVPILLVYPFVQRHFAKGVLIGAVKG